MSNVGDDLTAQNAAWSFGGDVPKNFQKHAKRSIPFYEEGHRLICYLSDFFLKNGSICYDLGTSTGELIKKLNERHSKKNIHYIGVDQEEKMIQEAIAKNSSHNIEFKHSRLIHLDWQKSNLIISYYTIQFTQLNSRQELIHKIYQNLEVGGAFLFFEKILSDHSKLENIAQSIYTDYKLDEGYDFSDIVNKTRSLKGVLEPNTSTENIELLRKAGFKHIMPVYKWVCFEGLIAIK